MTSPSGVVIPGSRAGLEQLLAVAHSKGGPSVIRWRIYSPAMELFERISTCSNLVA
jgi:hypothetical protein